MGAIAPGLYGGLIAVPGDPLTKVAVLEHVAWVMKGGAMVKEIAPAVLTKQRRAALTSPPEASAVP